MADYINKIRTTEGDKPVNYEALANKPNSLPNPNKIKFTGSVVAEYDGSSEVTVDIPNGASEEQAAQIQTNTNDISELKSDLDNVYDDSLDTQYYIDNDIPWDSGYIGEDGNIHTNIGSLSPYYYAFPGAVVELSEQKEYSGEDNRAVIFYDENANFIGIRRLYGNSRICVAPSKCYYVRLSIKTEFSAGEYIKIYNSTKPIFKSQKNIVCGGKWIDGGFYNEQGVITEYDRAKYYSSLIKVEPDTEYILNPFYSYSDNGDNLIVEFDKSQKNIGHFYLIKKEIKFKTSEKTYYLGISAPIKTENRYLEIKKNDNNLSMARLLNTPTTDNYVYNAMNILPLGANVNKDGIIALTKGTNNDPDSQNIDSLNIFWDSKKSKYGMVYTGYNNNVGSICLAWSEDLKKWTKDGTVMQASGINGAPDFGSVTAGNIFMDNGIYYLYYTGSSVAGYEAGELNMCLAYGEDIHNLQKYDGNPVISVEDERCWCPSGVYKSNIIKRNGVYYMFYNGRITITPWHESIGCAISVDLKNWTQLGIVLNHLGENNTDVVGDPYIYDIGDDNYYMAFFSNQKDDWSDCKDNIAKTKKKDFPYNWEVIYKDVTGDYRHTKPCIVYKGGKHYHFACNNTSEIKLYVED